MKDLDQLNPEFMHPSRFSKLGAMGAISLMLASIALAGGPRADIPFFKNPIVIALCVVLAVSAALLIIPFFRKWDWRAKFFGCSTL